MFEPVLNSCSALLPICLITGTLITLIIFRSFSEKQVNGLGEKYVLITGCDSGFGHETAIQLDKMGVCVLATCLTKEGEQSLKSATSDRLKTFQLDVTNSQQIKNLYTQVKEVLPSGLGRLNCKECRSASRIANTNNNNNNDTVFIHSIQSFQTLDEFENKLIS